MRGWPLGNALLVVALLLAAAVPLHRLTFGFVNPPTPQPRGQASAEETRESFLYGRFSHPPRALKVSGGKDEIYWATESAMEIEEGAFVALPLVASRMELRIEARWPEGIATSALELFVEPEGMETRSQTLWGDGGSVDEIVAWDWRRP